MNQFIDIALSLSKLINSRLKRLDIQWLEAAGVYMAHAYFENSVFVIRENGSFDDVSRKDGVIY